jgi:transketolase
VAPLLERSGGALARCEPPGSRCHDGADEEHVEECFREALHLVRRALEKDTAMTAALARRLEAARGRLDAAGRRPRSGAPRAERVHAVARRVAAGLETLPPPLEPGTVTTLRGELGRVLNMYNRASGGALLTAAADLLGSTSVSAAAAGFPGGYWHARANLDARLVSSGGICEDAMCGIMTGLSAYGRHVGVGSSYGAFIAPLGHIAARLHAIGAQARRAIDDDQYRPFILVCAHAGLKTGEDGPTHADPQALQLLQGNFPSGTLLTLTPWDPAEIGPLMAAALARRPAIIAPFVTRPTEHVPDRGALGLAPPAQAVSGLYLLRAARGRGDGTVVLQESGVAFAFVEEALPRLLEAGVDLNVYYVASAELFDALPPEERARIYPEARAREALGITGFTLPTMDRWILSERGRAHTLHPFRDGHYLGSGKAAKVLAEAGLDGESQYHAVLRYVTEGRAAVAIPRLAPSRRS